jgi:hypothetical protein
VVGGAIIGIGCAIFAHGMWYVLYYVIHLCTETIVSVSLVNCFVPLCPQVPFCVFRLVRLPASYPTHAGLFYRNLPTLACVR